MTTPADHDSGEPLESRDDGDPAVDVTDRQAEHTERRRSAIERGRRMAGTPGAMMAGAMMGLRDVLENPRDDRPVAEVEAPSDPFDVDRDGVELAADDLGGDADVAIAAQPRRAPIVPGRRRARRR